MYRFVGSSFCGFTVSLFPFPCVCDGYSVPFLFDGYSASLVTWDGYLFR